MCLAQSASLAKVPGLGFAEIGPGDLGLALGYTAIRNNPYPPEMQAARDRILRACKANRVPFLESSTPENIVARIDEGVRVIAGHNPVTARIGRAHQGRTLPE